MTLSAWVRPSALGNLYRTVLMKELDTGGAYGLYASTEFSAPAGWLETTEEAGGVGGSSPLPLNQWSHLAFTYSDGTGRLYVNGTQVEQASWAGDVLDDGGALRIGGNAFWDEFYSGVIDEVRVYNRAQSAAEIQTDMNTPIGAVPVARRAASTSAIPAIEKLEVSDDKGRHSDVHRLGDGPAGTSGDGASGGRSGAGQVIEAQVAEGRMVGDQGADLVGHGDRRS
ncbi:LamG domain-containing protein [Nonomuraea deserti]|uniref:LamG domain-containing protein n=1 Tax=Nonomuraea deserti TaxID=1848322 RepID=UPI001FE570D9|nr:LamG domain-containing protein [Nonomuraea deserti]